MNTPPVKFTKEIKDNWLANLKSGKYKQGSMSLFNPMTDTHCCIGVLGACTKGLENDEEESMNSASPYCFLELTVGYPAVRELWQTNDTTFNPDKPDYSNVIPIIEALPTQD